MFTLHESALLSYGMTIVDGFTAGTSFLDWHDADVADDAEQRRNWKIANRHQCNANPFVMYPGLARRAFA